MTSPQFYQQLRSVLSQQSAVVATIVKVIGSAPREVGAKMAVHGDGQILGTIGGGAGEGKVIEQALRVLEENDSSAKNQLVEIDLTGAPTQETQGICGGKVQVWLEVWSGGRAIALADQILDVFETGKSRVIVTPLVCDRSSYLADEQVLDQYPALSRNQDADEFVETIQPLPTLLIIGGGHVAVALAQIASFSGFQIAVQDDRPDFLTPERFPQASVLSHSMSEVLTQLSAHQLYVALVARGYPQDIEALKALLQRSLSYQYVGAIGSQKRIRMIHRAMRQQGISLESLPNFYAPIGLDLGALTPEEIAISICAELIKVRRGGTGRSLCERIQPSSTGSKVHAEKVDTIEIASNKRHYAYPLS